MEVTAGSGACMVEDSASARIEIAAAVVGSGSGVDSSSGLAGNAALGLANRSSTVCDDAVAGAGVEALTSVLETRLFSGSLLAAVPVESGSLSCRVAVFLGSGLLAVELGAAAVVAEVAEVAMVTNGGFTVVAAMAVCCCRAIGGSNQKFGYQESQREHVDHSGASPLTCVGTAKAGFTSLQIVLHSAGVVGAIRVQSGGQSVHVDAQPAVVS